jgi:hypothetical protein
MLWSALLNSPLSHRAVWTSTAPIPTVATSSGQIQSLLNLLRFAQDNFALLVLVLLGLVLSHSMNRRLFAVIGAIILCLGVFLGIPIIQANFHEQIGFLSGFDFTRAFRPVPFLLTVAAAIGLHLSAQRLQVRGVALVKQASNQYGMVLLALMIITFGSIAFRSVAIKKETIASAIDGACYACIYNHPDLDQLGQDIKMTVPPFRVVTIEVSRQRPAYAWPYGLEAADGYVNLYPLRYKEYWEQVVVHPKSWTLS